MIIHGGGFHKGDLFEQGQEQASAWLQSRGYFVVSITHRLAPCGHITGQDPTDPASGRPPNQTNDVKSAIRAVRADAHCNGHIGLLGGSSGASHALFCAFDKTPSPPNTYPNWCNDSPTDDDRPDCAVGLSGNYDFIAPPPGNNDTTRNVIANYTNTCVLLDTMGGPDQFSVSPVAQLKPESVQIFKPIYALNGNAEYQPEGQLQDLLCALQAKDIDPAKYKILTVIDPEGAHAFALWRVKLTPTADRRVRDEVTDFFDQYVKHAQ